jgi:hypothetical protein
MGRLIKSMTLLAGLTASTVASAAPVSLEYVFSVDHIFADSDSAMERAQSFIGPIPPDLWKGPKVVVVFNYDTDRRPTTEYFSTEVEQSSYFFDDFGSILFKFPNGDEFTELTGYFGVSNKLGPYGEEGVQAEFIGEDFEFYFGTSLLDDAFEDTKLPDSGDFLKYYDGLGGGIGFFEKELTHGEDESPPTALPAFVINLHLIEVGGVPNPFAPSVDVSEPAAVGLFGLGIIGFGIGLRRSRAS